LEICAAIAASNGYQNHRYGDSGRGSLDWMEGLWQGLGYSSGSEEWGGTSSQISDHETHPQLEGGGAHKNHMMNSQGDDHHYGLHLRH